MGSGHVNGGQPGRLRRALSRFAFSGAELEAEELRSESRESGATPVVDCVDRERATVIGVLRTVTLRPRAGVPALEAELYDGSGSLMVVWLGRRQIQGIEPGQAVEVSGLLTHTGDGDPVMFNPRYTLRPTGSR